MNKPTTTLVMCASLGLAACGGDTQTVNKPMPSGNVVYSFPADGQAEVSPKTDLVLRFSHPIADSELDSKILLSDGNGPVAVTASLIDGGHSLKLEPATELDPGTQYTVSFSEALEVSGAKAITTPNAVGEEGIQFTTRGSFSGIAGLDNLADDFVVEQAIPATGTDFKPMNFSTFRLRMTHPVHPDWQAMGGIIELRDSEGSTVPATVLVKGRYVTVDPCLADTQNRCGKEEDILRAGAEYTLVLQNLPSINGETLADYQQTITPRNTGPTVVLSQQLIDSEFVKTSRLNGETLNTVSLDSVLQGKTEAAQQTGTLFAELGYAPAFDANEALPLRIPRGSVLASTSLDVKVNGTVPVIDPATGQLQQTGEIRVTMLSDASGYLLPNPYTDDLNAPRHVRLFMDVSMSTEEAQPNAALNQNLLGLELVGMAIVEDGVLTIDALGMVEPNLLGQEFADSTIAFRIEAETTDESQLSADTQRDNEMADTQAPEILSWMPGDDLDFPGDRDQMHRPGDPVVINFSEPLDINSIASGVSLIETSDTSSTELSVADGNLKARLDGTSLVLNPVGGLKHGVDYTVNLTSSLTDLAGNGVPSQTLTFALPDLGDGSEIQRSPIALTTYPGFPCATTGVDLANDSHGSCVDAAPGGTVRDVMPVTTMPADRPIIVVFSQSMNLDSIRLGETFIVEKVDVNRNVIEPVDGRLEKNNQRIKFFPDEAWETDSYYRYTLRSADQASCTVGATSPFICGENQLALETNLLVDPERAGGPDMSIYFKGTAPVGSVFTPLRNLPIRDTNSNYVVDCTSLGSTTCLEPFAHEADGLDSFKPSANSAKLSVVGKKATALGLRIDASVGCPANQECPRNKFIYQTYGLNTEVIGPAEDGNGIRVLLYPTLLATTSASVFLQGFGEEATGPQILRMRYGTPTQNNPLGLVEGVIVENDEGQPEFRTNADLLLDAPNLELPLASALQHNLYSRPFTLELAGDIDFFDDGRMQIIQINQNQPPINVEVDVTLPVVNELLTYRECVENSTNKFTAVFTCLTEVRDDADTQRGDITIPLEIPREGVYLNFVSNAAKEIPAVE